MFFSISPPGPEKWSEREEKKKKKSFFFSYKVLEIESFSVSSGSLFQGIFPTQGSNSGLLYCRKILYQMSHQGRILGWVAYPFSRGSYRPRNRTGVSCIVGGFWMLTIKLAMNKIIQRTKVKIQHILQFDYGRK